MARSAFAVTVTELGVTALKTLTVPLMLVVELVRLASGHVPVWPVTLVTLTLMVHVPATVVLAGTVVPETLMLVAPGVAVTVPPVQVLTTFGVLAICSLVGNESTKLTTCTGLPVGGLVSVNVNVLTPPA